MNGVPEQDNGEPVGEGSSPGGIETLINAPVAKMSTVTTTTSTTTTVTVVLNATPTSPVPESCDTEIAHDVDLTINEGSQITTMD